VHNDPEPPKRDRAAPADWTPPTEVRKHIRPWVEVDEVGPQGFWVWLESLLPVLPLPERGSPSARTAAESPEVRLRQVARDLSHCASERARLTTVAAQYYQDNFVLALRVKALEAGLAQIDREGKKPTVADDEEARVAADKYLARGR